MLGLPSNQAEAAESDVQALQECIKQSTSGRDRIIAARWLMAGMGSAPQLRDLASIEPETKRGIDRQLAQLFTRLMTVDCLNEARPVFQSNDPAAMRAAGGTLGEIAMQEIVAHPETLRAVEGYAEFLNLEDFEVLRR